MRIPRKSRVFLSMLLCLALLCAGPFSPFPLFASLDDEDYDDTYDQDVYGDEDDYDEDVDEPSTSSTGNDVIRKLEQQIAQRNAQLKQYADEQAKIKDLLADTKDDLGQAVTVRNTYGDQIGYTESEINALLEKIDLLEQKIDEQELLIEDKQGEIDYSYDLFKRRLRAKYMQDNGTSLGLLLGTDDFAEFLTRTEYMSRIGQHDQDLMEHLTRERIAMEDAKAMLEDDMEEVEADKATTEAKKQELSQLYNAAALEVHELSQMEKEFNADLEKNVAMQAAMKAEINKLYQEIEFSKNPYAGGAMAWPMPGYSQISSYYGSRFGGSDFHTGTDITGGGCLGAPVVSANAGRVAFVNTSHTPGSGYGIYVMVDHGVNEKGQSVTTLYAHLSAATVSVGQTVARGEQIGKCGSTGWSTGPHLHFEVRLDGQWVNSLPYIQG